jgi:hypothetical protein
MRAVFPGDDDTEITQMTKQSQPCVPAVLLLGASLMAGPVAAQTSEAPPPPQERCTPNGAEPRTDGSGDLSQKLDDCNGVLTAPDTGDPDIVEPAPETGSGRVIDPDTVPPGGNPSNGSGG